jgi:hypothetical protein
MILSLSLFNVLIWSLALNTTTIVLKFISYQNSDIIITLSCIFISFAYFIIGDKFVNKIIQYFAYSVDYNTIIIQDLNSNQTNINPKQKKKLIRKINIHNSYKELIVGISNLFERSLFSITNTLLNVNLTQSIQIDDVSFSYLFSKFINSIVLVPVLIGISVLSANNNELESKKSSIENLAWTFALAFSSTWIDYVNNSKYSLQLSLLIIFITIILYRIDNFITKVQRINEMKQLLPTKKKVMFINSILIIIKKLFLSIMIQCLFYQTFNYNSSYIKLTNIESYYKSPWNLPKELSISKTFEKSIPFPFYNIYNDISLSYKNYLKESYLNQEIINNNNNYYHLINNHDLYLKIESRRFNKVMKEILYDEASFIYSDIYISKRTTFDFIFQENIFFNDSFILLLKIFVIPIFFLGFEVIFDIIMLKDILLSSIFIFSSPITIYLIKVIVKSNLLSSFLLIIILIMITLIIELLKVYTSKILLYSKHHNIQSTQVKQKEKLITKFIFNSYDFLSSLLLYTGTNIISYFIAQLSIEIQTNSMWKLLTFFIPILYFIFFSGIKLENQNINKIK